MTLPDPPADWLLEQRPLLDAQRKGRALDVACGRGRNSVLLARSGFDVDALDIDAGALEEVRRVSAEQALAVRAVQADVTRAPFPRPPYEVVINFNYLERAIFDRMVEALAPGGLLVFETFIREHVDVLGRRMNDRYLLRPNELLRAFAGLRVLRYREGIVPGDPQRAVASLVGRRP